ncbi:MAG: TetR/AcrR family transcriptional regulator [Gemmatimonadaceae bacterium]
MPVKLSAQRHAALHPAPPARAVRDRDTEARILDAAHAVFLTHGTAGARMQEIARQAGVNQALLHYYFRSKKKLAEAVFTRVVRAIIPPVIEVMGSDAPLEDKLRRAVHLYLDNLARSPAFPGYFLAELNMQPERAGQLVESMTGVDQHALRSHLRATLHRQIRERVRAGTMRAISPEEFIINLTALCIFPFAARPMYAALLGMSDADFRRLIKRRREELPDFILRALRP